MMKFRLLSFSFALAGFLATGIRSHASPVGLQNATATFSQSLGGDYGIQKAIDGITNDNMGWAIYDPSIPGTSAQTAVFETTSNIGFSGSTLLTFNILQNNSYPGQELGRFRLSVTTDNRNNFADGLHTGGNVGTNWTVLSLDSAVSSNGATLTQLADHSILASGFLPPTDNYTVAATTTLQGITGIRLEVMEDNSLPTAGPGRVFNGNFVLSEFSVDAASVPDKTSTLPLMGITLCTGLLLSRSQRGIRRELAK